MITSNETMIKSGLNPMVAMSIPITIRLNDALFSCISIIRIISFLIKGVLTLSFAFFPFFLFSFFTFFLFSFFPFFLFPFSLLHFSFFPFFLFSFFSFFLFPLFLFYFPRFSDFSLLHFSRHYDVIRTKRKNFFWTVCNPMMTSFIGRILNIRIPKDCTLPVKRKD